MPIAVLACLCCLDPPCRQPANHSDPSRPKNGAPKSAPKFSTASDGQQRRAVKGGVKKRLQILGKCGCLRTVANTGGVSLGGLPLRHPASLRHSGLWANGYRDNRERRRDLLGSNPNRHSVESWVQG